MNTKLLALGLAFALSAAGAAEAQSVQLSYGKQTSHGKFSISLSTPLRGERRTAPRQVWVPGHYQQVERKVWVEGSQRRVWVPPVYETRYDECGRPFSFLAREGFWNAVCEPAHFESRTVKVWVDGYFKTEYVTYDSGPALDLRYGHFEDRERYDGRYGRGRGAVRVASGGRFDGHRYEGRR